MVDFSRINVRIMSIQNAVSSKLFESFFTQNHPPEIWEKLYTLFRHLYTALCCCSLWVIMFKRVKLYFNWIINTNTLTSLRTNILPYINEFILFLPAEYSKGKQMALRRRKQQSEQFFSTAADENHYTKSRRIVEISRGNCDCFVAGLKQRQKGVNYERIMFKYNSNF